MSFYKIIGFTKRIYEYKSLSPNHVFTLKISRFTIFIVLLLILWIFIKNINLLNKIGPLWAHKGPHGPIRALWAHMGPNPDRAPTRTGPQPSPGQKTYPYFNTYLQTNDVFGLSTAFFDGFNVLLSFLAENDTERLWNHLRKQVWEPTRTVKV